MSTGPVATASVKIVPDLTGFRALLQAEVDKAVAGVKVPAIKANVAASALAASGASSGVGGRTAATAAKEIETTTKASNALRGSLIGLSRVTPVTVFGLGLYGTAALGAGLAIKSAIRSTADFEHQLNVFQATTGATAAQIAAVAAEAKALGADLSLPSTSAGDAARAMTELAKAGLSVKDTLAGARGVLQLAAAAQIDVGSAAEFVATELNAFQLSGAEATHVADLLAGASIAAQGDIRDFGTAFQQVSAVAHGANVSLETTTGLLTELARAGLRGADAGTSIRTFLLRLTPTTKQAAQYQEALNIRLDETKTIGEQLPALIGQYQKALSGISPILRQQALTQIFGQDAIRAATIIINGGTAALDKNTAAADQNGAAARLAAANAKGLAGAFNGLKSNADTLGISVGNLVKGPLTSLVTQISEVVSTTGKAVDAFAKLKRQADKDLSFKIPHTNTTGKDVQDQLFGVLVTPLLKIAELDSKATNLLIAKIRENREKVQREIRLAALQNGQGTFGVTSLADASRILPPADRKGTFGVTPLTPKTAADIATEARLKALQADKQKRKPKVADITPPRDLQIDQLNAQLNDSLQQELTADKAIEGYFRKRLTRAIKGTLRYKQILQALTQAHAATQSVLAQITSEQSAASAAAAQQAAKTKSDQEERNRQIVQAAKDEIDRRNALFDLRIQQADLGNNVARENKIRMEQINYLKGLRSHTKRLSAEWIAYSAQITSLRAAIASAKKAAAGAKSDSSSALSLTDIVKQAVSDFTTYGSNIAGSAKGVLSGQDARAAFGKQILDSVASQQLTEAQKQTAILTSIDSKVGAPAARALAGGEPTSLAGRIAANNGWRMTRQAAMNGWGSN